MVPIETEIAGILGLDNTLQKSHNKKVANIMLLSSTF